jgi:hypothetical protein
MRAMTSLAFRPPLFLLALLLAAWSFRAVVPVGFMPSAQGWVWCSGKVADGQSNPQDNAASNPAICPFALLSADVLPSALWLLPVLRSLWLKASPAPTTPPPRPAQPYQARAPPLF